VDDAVGTAIASGGAKQARRAEKRGVKAIINKPLSSVLLVF
jgi:hypothetical protein